MGRNKLYKNYVAKFQNIHVPSRHMLRRITT